MKLKVLGVLALIVVAVIYFYPSASPEGEIRKRLEEISETLEFDPELSKLQQVSLSNEIRDFFAEDLSIILMDEDQIWHQVGDKNAIPTYVMLAHKVLTSFILKVHDIEFESIDDKSALTYLDGAIQMVLKGEESTYRESGELKVFWIKEKNKWKIKTLENVVEE